MHTPDATDAQENEGNGHHHGHDGGHPKEVTIKVNNNAVVLTAKEVTGLEIKQAAISQGIQIEEDFVLQLEKPNGEFDTIGDNDTVHVHEGMCFTAIAPDDNS